MKKMSFTECLDRSDAIMMEGALGERLKREYHLSFDEHVSMAGLIYRLQGQEALYKNQMRKEVNKLKKLGRFDETSLRELKKKINA